MALPSDTYRKEQLLASLCRTDAPANSFTWGNLTTLKENVSDTTLYKSLHEFRARHYSAHRMTVAIQARLPMEVLEAYVLDCFSKVPSNSLPPDDFKQYAEGIYDTKAFKKMYYVKPVKDVCQVKKNSNTRYKINFCSVIIGRFNLGVTFFTTYVQN